MQPLVRLLIGAFCVLLAIAIMAVFVFLALVAGSVLSESVPEEFWWLFAYRTLIGSLLWTGLIWGLLCAFLVWGFAYKEQLGPMGCFFIATP